MARVGRIIAWTAGIIIGLPVLLIVVVLIGGNTGPGRHLIERLTPRVTGGEIHIGGLSGRFPDRLRATTLRMSDADGTWLTVEGLIFDWSPLRLVRGVLDIDRLDAASADLARMPAPSGGQSSGLPVQVAIHQFQVDRFTIGAPVAGKAYTVSINGAADLQSETAGSIRLTMRQPDAEGTYQLDASIDPRNVHAALSAREPAHGLIAGLAGLPDLGPLAIDAALDGPRDAVATKLNATAGPLRATAAGTLDLEHDAAALTVSASAPAMTPRPDISWQDLSVNARVDGPFATPALSGQVRIGALRAVGAGVDHLTADLSGNAGLARLHAALDGLTLPGQDPRLLAAAPMVLDATARLNAPDRPVAFTIRHPLVQVQGTARTAGAIGAHMILTLPDLAPVAAAGGQDVQGRTALTLDLTTQNNVMNIALNGTIGVTGGQRQAQALLGDAATVDLAASLQGQNATLTRLHAQGRSVDVAAHGNLIDARANLDWTLAIGDLSALEPTLNGHLTASGNLSGPEQDLAASAEVGGNVGSQGVESGPVTVHVAASGLPNHPAGTLMARGALLNAPIDVATAVTRSADGLDVTVTRATWKSLDAGGALRLPPGATIPQGNLHLRMAQLGDLAPLLHRQLAGSIDAAVQSSPEAAHLTVNAAGVAVPGTAAISRLALDATVTEPQGNASVQARLRAERIDAGGVSGASADLSLQGPQNALGLKLAARVPDVSGAPVRVDATATADLPARAVTIASLQADWRQQALRLLAPARLDFAGGTTVNNLRLGLGRAVLAVSGRVTPTLDLTASLRDLPVDIASVVSPAPAADGTIAAEARLTGSTARPEGTARLTATGVRLRSGPGAALPPADLIATTTLHGTGAAVDVRLTAGPSHIGLTGTAPLSADGPLDLNATGSMDLALLDPILTPQGRRLRGQLGLQAAIGGTQAAPRVTGTARLTGGDAQDFPMGVHITGIAATVQAEGDRLRLTQFTGRAGQGTIGATGTIGLAPPLPVDLTVTADNAQLLASPLITATIDARLTARGEIDGDLTAAGLLHARRVEIQVPNKLPSSVVVLPVQVAGAPAPPQAASVARGAQGPAQPASANAGPAAPQRNVALDITLDAPQQVFIRGRGLNVELGGRVHVTGTAAHPQAAGGLVLRRGTMSLVSQTLTFTEGNIDFVGNPITDPGIRLVATSSSATMVATLTVSGTATDPKITLSSTPPLPQDQILAQLLFNQDSGRLSPLQLAQIAAGLAQLAGAAPSGGGVLANLRNSLGLDQLTVGSGAAGGPTVQAGRYIARGVYVGAEQSATGSGTQATLQIDLARGLKLVTTAGSGMASATGGTSSGDEASVGLRYQFQY